VVNIFLHYPSSRMLFETTLRRLDFIYILREKPYSLRSSPYSWSVGRFDDEKTNPCMNITSLQTFRFYLQVLEILSMNFSYSPATSNPAGTHIVLNILKYCTLFTKESLCTGIHMAKSFLSSCMQTRALQFLTNL
jgi:hypothetical protein